MPLCFVSGMKKCIFLVFFHDLVEIYYVLVISGK